MRIISVAIGLTLLCAAAAQASESIPADPTKSSDAGSPVAMHTLGLLPSPGPLTRAQRWLPWGAVACDPENPSRNADVTASWTGRCADKLLDGPGELQLMEDGHITSTFSGAFIRGVAEGHVSIRFGDGAKFDGEFRHGLPNGPGTMRWPNGFAVEGGLRDDVPDGQVRIVFGSGNTVVRGYKNGVPDGPATVDWMDVKTVHSYRAGRLDGPVLTTYSDGSRLEFLFKDDQAEPVASFTDAAGHRIVGAFTPSRLDPTQPHGLSYPEDALRREETGRAYVSIIIGENGHVQHTTLTRSSGFEDLDNAALDAVKGWSYVAATIDGHSIPTSRLVPVTFVIPND